MLVLLEELGASALVSLCPVELLWLFSHFMVFVSFWLRQSCLRLILLWSGAALSSQAHMASHFLSSETNPALGS